VNNKISDKLKVESFNLNSYENENITYNTLVMTNIFNRYPLVDDNKQAKTRIKDFVILLVKIIDNIIFDRPENYTFFISNISKPYALVYQDGIKELYKSEVYNHLIEIPFTVIHDYIQTHEVNVKHPFHVLYQMFQSNNNPIVCSKMNEVKEHIDNKIKDTKDTFKRVWNKVNLL
jgi:hypothetical protein